MFNRIRVKNFRSIQDSGNLNLTRLNVIVGPNNSGKSSLLYAILLLKQTLDDKNLSNVLTTSGTEIDLGSYLDIIRDHNLNKPLTVEFDLNKEILPNIRFMEFESIKETRPFERYRFVFGFKKVKNEIYVKTFSLSDIRSRRKINGELTSSGWQLDGIDENIRKHIKPDFSHFMPTLNPRGKVPKEKDTVQKVLELCMFTSTISTPVCHLFEHINHVGPIRERIPRYGVIGTTPHSELGPSGQNLIRVLSQTQRRGKPRRTILQELNDWLDTKFGILKNVRLINIDKSKKTIKMLIADDPQGSKSINLAEMGSGISQIVPVVLQTVLTPAKGCLIVEQPEIHLHPAAQADLGDLFVYYAREDNKQMIVETHSEHLLLRIRRRVAEGKISPDLVRIFLVSKHKNETKVKPLNLGKNGHFKKWPKDFFEEGYREALAIAEAQS